VLSVIEPGPLSTVQDRGRVEWLHQGVGRSGAFDHRSFALANRLVGNLPGAAGVEILLGGFRATALADCVVALTGAQGPASCDRNRAVQLAVGDEISVGPPSAGVRSYLAVRGGVDVTQVLGSRSWDSLGRFGPAPLTHGDLVAAGLETSGDIPWFEPVSPGRPIDAIRLVRGPHADLIDAETWERLLGTNWTVSDRADRVGVQLIGRRLGAPAADLASFPVLPGSIQLPPDGFPLVLGPDAGTTGGYAVIAVIDPGALSQHRPGQAVRFALTR
jgi:biotin-dependent carboxylase-like uncharacterized protein